MPYHLIFYENCLASAKFRKCFYTVEEFFDFDYQVECFVPQAKRKIWIVSLPVLPGDTFVVKMDSKADRKQRIFFVTFTTFSTLHLLDSIKCRPV